MCRKKRIVSHVEPTHRLTEAGAAPALRVS
jgi:hypothetical protein